MICLAARSTDPQLRLVHAACVGIFVTIGRGAESVVLAVCVPASWYP